MGDLRIFNLRELKEKFNLKYFVETGTLFGEGVDHALNHGFDDVYSIEIDKELYDRAITKYAFNAGVNIIHGSSHEKIKDLLSLDGNCLFWLDAHFPSADCNKKSYTDEKDMEIRAPLQTEIELLSQRKNKYKDVIIADDFWLYNTEHKYESGDIESHMRSIGQNITREELVGDVNDRFFYDNFSDTHDLQIIANHQGYMIISPKGI